MREALDAAPIHAEDLVTCDKKTQDKTQEEDNLQRNSSLLPATHPGEGEEYFLISGLSKSAVYNRSVSKEREKLTVIYDL